jgi:multimeric flavodoxin WrbA
LQHTIQYAVATPHVSAPNSHPLSPHAHPTVVYVPLGFANSFVSSLDEISGGSAWGASTVAGGDGSRQPLAGELSLAEYQGKVSSLRSLGCACTQALYRT